MNESIVAAAVRSKRGLVCFMPKPARHNDIIHAMVDEGLEPPIVGVQVLHWLPIKDC